MKPRELADSIISELSTIYEDSEARSLSRIVLEEVYGLSTADIVVNRKLPEDTNSKDRLRTIIDRLLAFEPIQHILGFSWFMGDKYLVDPHVLIPRQETEELVDLIVKESAQTSPMILDIGTGSGCIPISLKKGLPGAILHATEVSTQALEVAQENARRLEADVNFHLSDILNEFPPLEKLDIIVSNPPYVTEKEKEVMNWNVLDHEPAVALFVPDDDPLRFYRSISQWALEKLKTGGKLYFEINETLGPETKKLLDDMGFNEVMLLKDLNGKDRFIKAHSA